MADIVDVKKGMKEVKLVARRYTSIKYTTKQGPWSVETDGDDVLVLRLPAEFPEHLIDVVIEAHGLGYQHGYIDAQADVEKAAKLGCRVEDLKDVG